MEHWLQVNHHKHHPLRYDNVCIEALSVGKVSLFIEGHGDSASIWLKPEDALRVAAKLAEAVTELEQHQALGTTDQLGTAPLERR